MLFKNCEITKQSYSNSILNRKNVVGLGVGTKWSNNEDTHEPAVLVFVQKKIRPGELSKLSADDEIPPYINNIPTDVIEVGHLTKLGYKGRVRPIKPGYSISHPKVTAGTLGGIFLDRDGDTVVLSNNHVLANENKAKIGDIILQPSVSDTFGDIGFYGWKEPISNLPYFATLKDMVKLSDNNIQDSAIAKIHERFIAKKLIDFNYPDINKPMKGFTDPAVGMKVQKFGRTSGHTISNIIGVKASFTISYDIGDITFEDCFVCQGFSEPGDSGSIIFDENMNAVGLLFAGSAKVTLATPINHIIDRYGLSLVSSNYSDLSNGWAMVGKGITVSDNKLTICSEANASAYIEQVIRFSNINIKINTSNDTGMTWGPGVSLSWNDHFCKVNLRAGHKVGWTTKSGSHSEQFIDMNVRNNTDYLISFINNKNKITAIINDGFKTVEIGSIKYDGKSVLARIGKMDMFNQYSSHSELGNIGTTYYQNLSIG